MIDKGVKELAQGANYAVLTTLTGTGQPVSHVVWVDADDDYVKVNTEAHRLKFKNVERDPRVSVMVIDAGNPYHFAEVRGRVADVVRGERARAHIDELSQKYTGGPYGAPIQSERVILNIAPERQRAQ